MIFLLFFSITVAAYVGFSLFANAISDSVDRNRSREIAGYQRDTRAARATAHYVRPPVWGAVAQS